MRTVAEERTGWRDVEISQRHRLWGWNCPGVDLDFVLVEYNHGKACALVDYKHEQAQPVNTKHPSLLALVDLADGYRDRPLPCFIARYRPANWMFLVTPLNEAARNHYSHCADEWIKESRFVRSLYLLRKSFLSAADEAVILKLEGQSQVLTEETFNSNESYQQLVGMD